MKIVDMFVIIDTIQWIQEFFSQDEPIFDLLILLFVINSDSLSGTPLRKSFEYRNMSLFSVLLILLSYSLLIHIVDNFRVHLRA